MHESFGKKKPKQRKHKHSISEIIPFHSRKDDTQDSLYSENEEIYSVVNTFDNDFVFDIHNMDGEVTTRGGKGMISSSKSDSEMKTKRRRSIENVTIRKNTSNYDFTVTDKDEIQHQAPVQFVDYKKPSILYKLPKLRRVFTPEGVQKRGIFTEFVQFHTDEKGRVYLLSGTLRDLIEWCSFFPGSPTTQNLLLYYRVVYSPKYLFNAILDLFCLYEIRSTLVSQDILERFYAFIAQWIIYWYPRDIDDQLSKAILQFFSQKFAKFNGGQGLCHIHHLLSSSPSLRPPNIKFGTSPLSAQKTLKRKYTKLSPRSFSPATFPLLSPRGTLLNIPPSPSPSPSPSPFISPPSPSRSPFPPPPSPSPSPSPSLSSSQSSLFSPNHRPSSPQPLPSSSSSSLKKSKLSLYREFKYYSVNSYVQLFTALESSLFEGVELEEFLDKNWQKENKEEVAARLCSLSNHFNMVSLWVASVILSISSLRKQIKLMRRFIRICHRLMKIRNYSSTAQLIAGLNNVSVSRIKAIKNGLSEKYRRILSKLEAKFNPHENYKNYRKLSKRGPCLPFLPMFLRDLSVLEDTSPTFIDKPNKVLNLDKINTIGNVIYREINVHDSTSTTYSFIVPKYHLDAFKHLLYGHALDEEDLYSRSLSLLPHLQSMSSSHLLSSSSISPSTSSSLSSTGGGGGGVLLSPHYLSSLHHSAPIFTDHDEDEDEDDDDDTIMNHSFLYSPPHTATSGGGSESSNDETLTSMSLTHGSGGGGGGMGECGGTITPTSSSGGSSGGGSGGGGGSKRLSFLSPQSLHHRYKSSTSTSTTNNNNNNATPSSSSSSSIFSSTFHGNFTPPSFPTIISNNSNSSSNNNNNNGSGGSSGGGGSGGGGNTHPYPKFQNVYVNNNNNHTTTTNNNNSSSGGGGGDDEYENNEVIVITKSRGGGGGMEEGIEEGYSASDRSYPRPPRRTTNNNNNNIAPPTSPPRTISNSLSSSSSSPSSSSTRTRGTTRPPSSVMITHDTSFTFTLPKLTPISTSTPTSSNVGTATSNTSGLSNSVGGSAVVAVKPNLSGSMGGSNVGGGGGAAKLSSQPRYKPHPPPPRKFNTTTTTATTTTNNNDNNNDDSNNNNSSSSNNPLLKDKNNKKNNNNNEHPTTTPLPNNNNNIKSKVQVIGGGGGGGAQIGGEVGVDVQMIEEDDHNIAKKMSSASDEDLDEDTIPINPQLVTPHPTKPPSNAGGSGGGGGGGGSDNNNNNVQPTRINSISSIINAFQPVSTSPFKPQTTNNIVRPPPPPGVRPRGIKRHMDSDT